MKSKRKPYSKTVIENYVAKNLENTSIVSFLNFQDKRLQKVFYDDLPNTIMNGYPFSSDFVDDKGKSYTYNKFESLSPETQNKCKLRFFYLPNYHELYIGTTGSGKTTGCIEPQIRAISSQKNKPNLFITDPKGELFEHHAKHLKDNGYNLFILNFKSLSRSNTWNPLEEMYEKQMEYLQIGKDIEVKNGYSQLDKYVLMADKARFRDPFYYVYKGMAFPTSLECDNFIKVEQYMCRSQVSSLVNQFCSCVFANRKGDQKTWVDGARGLMNGILLTMLEEAIKPYTKFKKQHMTLKTVNDVFALLRDGTGNNSYDLGPVMRRYLKGKSLEAMNKLNTVIATADVTRKGFFSAFQSEVEKWMQGHIFQLTAETSIKLDDNDKPWAIFIATRDYDKSDNVIAGLFIDWVYRQSLKSFERKQKEAVPSRHVHFLLDEFANIPMIPDFDNKISTARSRNIWFHLFVQSYDQLDLIYGHETANIIIDNCNQQSFLGSQSQETKERFSNQCGKRTVQSLEGILNGQTANLIQVPAVQISALDLITPGEMYTKRIYSPVLKCSYIRSYQCASLDIFKNFYDTHAFEKLVPINNIIPDDYDHTFESVMSKEWVRQKRIALGQDMTEDLKQDEEDEDEEFDFEKFKRR